jgi:hypothetical protein
MQNESKKFELVGTESSDGDQPNYCWTGGRSSKRIAHQFMLVQPVPGKLSPMQT